MNDTLHISQAGLDFIRQFEGLRLRAYYDSVHVLTIGYGHTNLDNVLPHVVPGMTITAEQAEEILQRSLAVNYEISVKRIVTVPLTQHEFDALVSFCYNCGEGNLKRLVRYLDQGDYNSIPRLLMQYDRAGGKVYPGLVRRRSGEAAMWKSEPYDQHVAEHVAARDEDMPTMAVDAPADDNAAMPQLVDRPDELPDKIAKWGGALSPFSMVLAYATDWRVLAVVCTAVLAGAAMYLFWRKKVS